MVASHQLGTRQHPRIDISTPVILKIGNGSVAARTRNVSMSGLFIGGVAEIPYQVSLKIVLPGLSRQVSAIGRVERRDTLGVALSFVDIDWDDLLLMAQYFAPRL